MFWQMKIDPRLERSCPWERLSESHWVDLISKRPELMCHWTGRKLSPYSWVRLIEKCPVAAFGCPWGEFSEDNWAMLLRIRPQYEDLHVIYTETDLEKIMKVLFRVPALIAHCGPELLEKLKAWKDWVKFVSANPHWARQ